MKRVCVLAMMLLAIIADGASAQEFRGGISAA